MSLCASCGGTGWRIVERSGVSGAERCSCVPVKPPEPKTPLTKKMALYIITNICDLLDWSPGEDKDAARSILALGLLAMCETEEQAKWLERRAPQLYSKWSQCGLVGLRQILCSRYQPKDGWVVSMTAEYPDGIPPEKRIEEPPRLALPPGDYGPADPKLQALAESASRRDAQRALGQTGAPASSTPDGLVSAAQILGIDLAANRLERKAAARTERMLREVTTPPEARKPVQQAESITPERRMELQMEIDRAVEERRLAMDQPPHGAD